MKAQIYVNRHIMAANKKESKEAGKIVDRPALSIKTSKGTIYAKEIEFTAGCKLIQDANNARCSGATIWVETEFESLIIDGANADRSIFGKVRHKDLEQKVLTLEEYFWQFVEEVNWKESQDYKVIASRLSLKYGASQSSLEVMFWELQKGLMKKLNRRELWLSDDDFPNFAAHIIGMGQNEYYRVLKEPELAIAYRNSEIENFSNVFAHLEA